ncbi:MAG: hypothetical protein COW24_05000 [Candidatus Kerfeldbacteria bacterium CG15_BIG_FIL_POST_REV_8_21_14_020_45_12]|uniref:Uncharacterized protein n=1 Tax=Candidatus Kerfeldbacteria bacterium CG15_BIG_FIL_POST_REV_8_21_14_020_45_12 TaxID=2014247 RepID=A0A2M7H2R2_9BACT|nr:MAG: hypothetical protein COW24_05000 [Candidatus Kerfeldbacteria bacterium CG15_BIG_FIL_POST_REV_8_21_14_020_45_12]PJA93229.1 MAG: hypothetical protein CO132_03915 [Candidatus Kerfeldbacteria bacterium CG_4_9_14_3_um_filter_45_8]
MSQDQFSKINQAAKQGSSPEDLYAAFQEELLQIQKDGESELETLRRHVDEQRLADLKNDIEEL